MSKRILHEICINAPPKQAKKWSLMIGKGRTAKEVSLRTEKDRISVTCALTTKQAPDSSLSSWSPALSRGLKTAMLLHILLYGREVRIRKLFWRLGDTEFTEYPTDGVPFIYSLLRRCNLSSLNEDWKSDGFIQTVLELSQREKDYRLAALHAYLMGKCAESETERFFYLWMSVNGLYKYYNCEVLEKTDYGEKQLIKRFLQYYTNNSSLLDDREREKCFEPLNRMIFQSKDFLQEIRSQDSETSRRVCNCIQEQTGKNYRIDAYFYYLLQQAYTFRCNLFHANRPVKILSYAEESEIILLRTLSDLLEEFLDRELPRWFDGSCVIGRQSSEMTVNIQSKGEVK